MEGPIVTASFDQEHAFVRPGAQPVREDATRRSGADDDVVELHGLPSPHQLSHARQTDDRRSSARAELPVASNAQSCSDFFR